MRNIGTGPALNVFAAIELIPEPGDDRDPSKVSTKRFALERLPGIPAGERAELSFNGHEFPPKRMGAVWVAYEDVNGFKYTTEGFWKTLERRFDLVRVKDGDLARIPVATTVGQPDESGRMKRLLRRMSRRPKQVLRPGELAVQVGEGPPHVVRASDEGGADEQEGATSP